MKYGIPTLVVNTDKDEYFPQTRGWLAQLALLQGTVPPGLTMTDPLIGSWRGDQVEIVVSGPSQYPASPAIQELAALYALTDQGENIQTVYWHLRRNFTDLGRKLGSLIARTPGLWDFCFEPMTTSVKYSWVTVDEAQRLVYGLRDPLGDRFIRTYKEWLARRRGVPHEVNDLLDNSGCRSDLKNIIPAL